MASNFSIKEFPNDDKCWRVDGVGKVSRNPNVDSEPRVQILLSALRSDYDDPLKGANRTGETKRIWVGVGQLPLISMGSVWQKKELIRLIDGAGGGGRVERFKIDTLLTKPFKPKTHSWNASILLEDQVVPCLPGNYYFVGKENYPHLADSLLWVYPVHHPRYSVVLIPPYEILRSYYLSSNKVTRAVFENDIGLLIDKQESKFLEDKTVHLLLLKTTDDIDAWFIARWHASDKTRTQIDLLNRSYAAASANTTSHSDFSPIGSHIAIDFPFDGATNLKVVGKPIKLHPKNIDVKDEKEIWGFLVFNIIECTHPMPYGRVLADRKNDSRKGQNSDDPELPETAFPGPLSGEESTSDGSTTFASDEEPDNTTKPRLQITFATRFTDLIGKQLIRNPKLIQRYKSGRKSPPPEREFTQHGTGEGTTGATSTGKVDVQQQQPSFGDKLPPHIPTFIEAIQLIRAQKRKDGWTVSTIQVQGRGRQIDETDFLTCFPSKIKGCISWHLISRIPNIPRALVVARVDTPIGTSYILEMERKGDAHCVLILYAQDRSPIEEATINLFLATTAKKNQWPLDDNLPFLKRAKVPHNKKRTPQGFANAILNKLESLR